MKVLALTLFILSAFPWHAFADEYECSDDGYCHQVEVTSEDLGRVDDSYCGDVVLTLATDGNCHQYSPCGADEGLALPDVQTCH